MIFWGRFRVRSDIHWVDLDPAGGSEADKVRPAVLVSNDTANQACQRRGRGVVSVAPITGNTTRVLPFQVLLPAADSGLNSESKAQAEQVRAIASERVHGRIGALPGTPAEGTGHRATNTSGAVTQRLLRHAR